MPASSRAAALVVWWLISWAPRCLHTFVSAQTSSSQNRSIVIDSEFCSCALPTAGAPCSDGFLGTSCLPDFRIELINGPQVLSQFECPRRSFVCTWQNIPVDDEFLNVRVTDLALAVGILSRVVADVQNITAAAGPVSTELPSLTLGSGSERTTIEVIAATPTPTAAPTLHPSQSLMPTPTPTSMFVDAAEAVGISNELEELSFLNLWRFKSDRITVLVLLSLVGTVCALSLMSVVIDRVRHGSGGKVTESPEHMSYVPRTANVSRIFTNSFSTSVVPRGSVTYPTNGIGSFPSRLNTVELSSSALAVNERALTTSLPANYSASVRRLSASATASKMPIPEDRSADDSQYYMSSRSAGSTARYHARILLTGLALVDFLGDWLFAAERLRLVALDKAGALDYDLAFPPILPLVFVAMPMVVNIGIVVRVLVVEFRSKEMRDWFQLHSTVGTLVILLSLGHIDVLAMLHSRTFGCRRLGSAFNAPISSRTQQDFFWFGIIGHFLEDIPQICFQVIVITTERSSIITAISFATSALTLLFGITRRLIFVLLVSAARKDQRRDQLEDPSITESHRALTLPSTGVSHSMSITGGSPPHTPTSAGVLPPRRPPPRGPSYRAAAV